MIDEAARSITNLPGQVAGLDADGRARFADLFAVPRSGGSLLAPDEMRPWMELFAQPVVAFDPWKLAGAVREAFPAA